METEPSSNEHVKMSSRKPMEALQTVSTITLYFLWVGFPLVNMKEVSELWFGDFIVLQAYVE